ncbi:SPOR domain-containing protein [Synechococcus sp. PCC 7502]|uniref:SPOR domain-containing protein n=1 Tax=Synechococcus sp. PCC 7502 TaxID=1173263 RepID=UPI00059D0A39|nr:hypothetical protein [Synechococcus sp. PCC 7502]
MSSLKDHIAGIGILLGVATGQMCLAQNVSFPADVTIRRSTYSAPKSNPTITNSDNGSQYLVYVPNTDNLQRVKTVTPDAFISSLDSGQRVVQVGRFSNLDFAQRQIAELKRAGIDAQVQTVRVAAPVPIASSSVTAVPIAPPLPDVPYTPGNANTLTIPPVITPLPAPPSLSEASKITEAARNRYLVIIPSTAEVVLVKARAIVPSAKLSSSNRGSYIEVQSYPDRSSAETLNATMRSQGLDSRVIYF